MGNFFEFLRTSFWHVLPILLSGAFAAVIVAERVRALFKVYPIHNSHAFFEKISDLIMAGKMGEAINHCDKYSEKPAAVVTKQALLRESARKPH
jgi:hypothetical protein